MKKLIIIIVLAALTSCVTSRKFNNISVGMTKAQVIEKIGNPKTTKASEGVVYLIYNTYSSFQEVNNLSPEAFFVKLINNKVISYGRVGDFNSTKNPTMDINITTKKRK